MRWAQPGAVEGATHARSLPPYLSPGVVAKLGVDGSSNDLTVDITELFHAIIECTDLGWAHELQRGVRRITWRSTR